MQVLEKILGEIEENKLDTNKYRGANLKAAAKQWNNGMDSASRIIRSHMEDDGWIPADMPPENDRYILLSFANFSLPLVGRYEADGDGGAYYVGDDDKSCISQDMVVNGWQELPEPYREEEETE